MKEKYSRKDIYTELGISLDTLKECLKDIETFQTVKHGVSTYYSKEEYERIIEVYIYRMLGYSHKEVHEIMENNVDYDQVIDSQIKVMEENIKVQTRWLNILKCSKKTGISVVELYNMSKNIGFDDNRKNFNMFAELLKNIFPFEDESIWNLDIYYNDEEYIETVVSEIASYIVLLCKEHEYNSEIIQNKLEELVELGSKVCGQSLEIILPYISQKVYEYSKINPNYSFINEKNDKATDYYYLLDNQKSIINYYFEIYDLVDSKKRNKKIINAKIDELFQYCDSIKILNNKGKIKFINLYLETIIDPLVLELLDEIDNREKYNKTKELIVDYFYKKAK